MSDLCAACGLCCSGWLFRDVRITAAEAEALSIEPVFSREGDRRLRLPCELHTGCACSRYDNRPSICRTFSCKSLTRHLQGELTFDEALEIVRAAVAQGKSLEELLRASGWTQPGETFGAAWWRLIKLAANDDPRDRVQHGPILLAALDYLRTVERSFTD